MPTEGMFRESRRSTRVPLKIHVRVEGGFETFEGETVVVNLHGALISVAALLRVGMKISIHVFQTGKNSAASVVYVNPENPLLCGIELEHPHNIWGVSLPPGDWEKLAEGRS